VPDHRRKWDKEEYERVAQERLQEDADELDELLEGKREPAVKRELLKPREYKVTSLYIVTTGGEERACRETRTPQTPRAQGK
jgi:hypothetical protein